MVMRCDYKQRIPNTRDPQCDHLSKMSQLMCFGHLKVSDLFSRGLIGGVYEPETDKEHTQVFIHIPTTPGSYRRR